MGNIQDPRKNTKQPKEGALDTNKDKAVEDTPESSETEESIETEADEEEQGTTEKTAEEESAEVAEEGKLTPAPKEETVAPEQETEEEPQEIAEKKPRRGKAPAEEEIVEERTYTIPLRRAWVSPRKKRVPKAVRMVRNYIQRHMKIKTGPKTGEEEEEGERLVISNEVNERLWGRGIEKPPRNIRIRAVKDKEGTVTLYLAEGD